MKRDLVQSVEVAGGLRSVRLAGLHPAEPHPSGELKRLIEEDGLRGVTSNPAIFEKAIMDSWLSGHLPIPKIAVSETIN